MTLLEFENPNATSQIQLKMRGPVFEAGIPVPLLVDSLSHVQGILDKAYLGIVNRRRMSREDRLRFYLRTPRIEHASLEADLGVIYAGAQTVLPFFGALGSSGIWEYTKSAYEFIKLVFESVKKDQKVDYQFNADRSVMSVNTGTQTQVFNGPVYNIAAMSIGHYQGLAETLDRSRVIDIRLGEGVKRDIGIALPEKDLFSFPSRIEDVLHRIECELYEFDKFDRDGRLRVGPGQTVPEGQYRFDVIGSQATTDYVEAMLEKTIRVTCLREVAENPISGNKVFRLQVISIDA